VSRINAVNEIIAYIYRNRCVTYDSLKSLYEELCRESGCPSWTTVKVMLSRYKRKGKLSNPVHGVWCSGNEPNEPVNL